MRALHTDLYQLTMAAGYFHRQMGDRTATCELFVRRLPKPRRYLVAAGIEQALSYLERLRFTDEQISYLHDLPALRDAMTPEFEDYLRQFRFRGDVWAVPEGTIMFANEPFIRVTAPLIEAQIAETFLLSTINHATKIASKAARIVQAARGRSAMEFGTRRVHPESAVDAARAAYLVGFIGTSNVEAGQRYGIPVLGTAAHMWTMTHDSEEAAFESYVAVFPSSSILLIDTYDTVRGARRAARIARDKLEGVRLDSGDMLELSRRVRSVLDAEGCQGAQIVASGDLNEYRITELLDAGAPIDVFGVGTELVTSRDAPALGGVYKVVQFEHEGRVVPIAKFSEGKVTYPGPHQAYRVWDDGGHPARDILALADEPAPAEARPLLVERMRAGERTVPATDLEQARGYARAELAQLSATQHDLSPPAETYPVEPSERLQELLAQVRQSMS